jgi:hypothetical protein
LIGKNTYQYKLNTGGRASGTRNLKTEIMKAKKITIELEWNNEIQTIHYMEKTLPNIIKRLEEHFKGCKILSINLEY